MCDTLQKTVYQFGLLSYTLYSSLKFYLSETQNSVHFIFHSSVVVRCSAEMQLIMRKIVLPLLICFRLVLGGFPYTTPTEGSPWPVPQNELRGDGFLLMDVNAFAFRSIQNDCPILQSAYARYLNILKLTPGKKDRIPNPSNDVRSLFEVPLYFTTLDVSVLQPCESLPYLNMDEQYELKVCAPDNPTGVTLVSQSVWGALRGLETFSQLAVRYGKDTFSYNCTQILDFPRFAHRGVLLDTARHFLPVRMLQQNLDIMSMNKFNVLHWHIVDSQSFPYQSEIFPDLSAKGAWSNIHVYTKEDILEVIEYARNLGIRVVAEFDTPGHTDSWGPGQPGLLTECYRNGVPDGSYGPVNPTNENNYVFLEKLFEEVSERYPERYIHIGGDEVAFLCWKSNPDITSFMESQNMTGDYHKLEGYYIRRLTDIISKLANKNGYIVWEEVFDNNIPIALDAIVHVWRGGYNPSIFYSELDNVTAAGYQAILSSCWYLNYISFGDDWQKYYECDPQGFNGTEAQKKLVLGGEACMWAEFVDETNIIPRLWPRAAAVAERLWSSVEATSNSTAATQRLEEHRCRLFSRGYPVEPLGPSYCEGVL